MAPKSVDEGWVTVRIPRRTHERLEALYAEVETGGLRLLGRELEFYADGEKRELGARNSRGLLLHVAVEALERARRAGAPRPDADTQAAIFEKRAAQTADAVDAISRDMKIQRQVDPDEDLTPEQALAYAEGDAALAAKAARPVPRKGKR